MKCKFCGDEIVAERAALGYAYCVKKDCVKQGLKPIELIVLGVNKSAGQFYPADETVRDKVKQGELSGNRRTAGISKRETPVVPHRSPAATPKPAPVQRKETPATRTVRGLPGGARQQKLVLIYNEQGKKPQDIAQLVGLSRYDVTKIILARKGTR